MTSCDDGRSQEDRILSVAVPRPLQGLFTYRLPSFLVSQVQVGGRVRVPFGRTALYAFIVEPPQPLASLHQDLTLSQLKDVIEVEGLGLGWKIPEDVMALCQWAHRYYLRPLGEVLQTAVPSFLFEDPARSRRRTKKKGSELKGPRAITLTEDQTRVFAQLNELRTSEPGQVAVLKGVTGSGKTEVYIELARRYLEEGKSVLILVPEIVLTPQLQERFENALGVKVGLWHSATSKQSKRAILGEEGSRLRVVLGARSAVFAPLPHLGLIVVDEEHDPTYKQEDRFRYHARDLAVVRGKLTGASVLLGSATPSLETLERVAEGRYRWAELKNRYFSAGLPMVEFVDLRTEPQIQNIQAILAESTVQAIQQVLDAGQQVMIFLNRRGYASFLLCKDCGKAIECQQCSVSLTFYKKRSQLLCHLCGYVETVPDQCRSCDGSQLLAMGAGTESLEEDLSRLVSGAKILRLDRDQVTSNRRVAQVLEEYRSGQSNILLGTQMIVKGHDFPKVTLVIVVLADGLYRWPDFRAAERAFQVLKQVSGRAGRGNQPGKVLIQTFDPEHPVLQAVQGRVTEEDFFRSEKELRRALSYPPYGRLARLRFEGASGREAKERAKEMADQLNQSGEMGLIVLGPSEAFLEKVKNKYRWDILLKTGDIRLLQNAVSKVNSWCALKKWPVMTDIDPYSV